MLLKHVLMMFVEVGFVMLAGLACGHLLKAAQGREDDEDERLWHYLLNQRAL